jgi:hypothetical protein
MSLRVVTVVKDDLPGLQRTKQSVHKQSIKVNWILVTPQDSSTTYEYAHQLLETGIISAILVDKGHGVYPAMNQAIDSAEKNDWLWFLNAGDEIANTDTYEHVSRTAQTTSHGWIYGGHYLGSSSGKILGEVKSPIKFLPANQLFAKRYISHQSTLFRASFLQELGGFRTDLKIASDWDLMVRAWTMDPGLRIPETLSIFYMGGLSTVSRQVGNVELLSLRKTNLGRKYALKSYWWFGYRWIRNKYVQSFEHNFPTLANRVRTIRLKIRSIGN